MVLDEFIHSGRNAYVLGVAGGERVVKITGWYNRPARHALQYEAGIYNELKEHQGALVPTLFAAEGMLAAFYAQVGALPLILIDLGRTRRWETEKDKQDDEEYLRQHWTWEAGLARDDRPLNPLAQ
eukprot:m51a1_g4371 hypothetical protein (126) ;mRNA; f:311824-312462